ncbi:UNVERIFIED_CONTAM: hypothetical protein Sradi_5682900 [Sesamum radiatum]|uniref:CCHC-type domain-containing protein n=1 Tax=Sesamum radiatum TaxID=300843 RepID=A0AAW2L4R2_SESRA
MKGILIQQKVFKAISGAYPDNASEEKIVEDDEIAYSSIILNLSDTVIRKVGTQNSAKELWEKLEELYTETSLPTKLFFEKFFKYKLDLSKNIDENIDEFTKLIQDIKLTGDKSIDDYSPIVLLNAIPDTYNDVKSAIKYGEENKNRNSGYKFRRHSKNRSRSRGRSNSRPKYQDDKNRNEKQKEEKNRDDRRCYNCGGRGHFIKECKKPKKKNPNESANTVDENHGEVYMICDVNAVNLSANMNEWLVILDVLST